MNFLTNKKIKNQFLQTNKIKQISVLNLYNNMKIKYNNKINTFNNFKINMIKS